MRLLVWNCQMAFRRKCAAAAAWEPDLLIIPESESPALLARHGASLPWASHVWIGDNPAKGLSVFARDGIALRLKRRRAPQIRFAAAVEVTGLGVPFDLHAVWTQAGATQTQGYVMHGLDLARRSLPRAGPATIYAGDFNSSPVFKVNGRRHLDLVDRFGRMGFTSLYHRQTDEAHGAETQATFFLHRDRARPYHLDYVFAHRSRPARLTLGAPDRWLTLSDHMPLIADF
jgi:exodeoxyribonuclease-3